VERGNDLRRTGWNRCGVLFCAVDTQSSGRGSVSLDTEYTELTENTE
jgi:hypothetical protein